MLASKAMAGVAPKTFLTINLFNKLLQRNARLPTFHEILPNEKALVPRVSQLSYDLRVGDATLGDQHRLFW